MTLQKYKKLLYDNNKNELALVHNKEGLLEIIRDDIEYYVLFTLFKNLLSTSKGDIHSNKWLKNFSKSLSEYLSSPDTRNNISDDSLYNLFPRCDSVVGYGGVELSCETFVISPKEKLKTYILSKIYTYRSKLSKQRRCTPHSIIPKQTIYKIGEIIPKNKNDLKKISFFNQEDQFKEHGEHILDIILNAQKKEFKAEFKERNGRCNNPQVIPNLDKNYLEYNIYDWLHYHKFSSNNPNKPKNYHFGIKLAGYFNRMKELMEKLICYECDAPLVPNWEYAKNKRLIVDYNKLEDGFIEINFKNKIGAAYRVTRFQCVSKKCNLFEKDIYINHCIGYRCFAIIDEREFKSKCMNDWVICENCFACCDSEKHEKGSCIDCRNPLVLFEKNGSRFVYCSNKCDFKITSKNLHLRYMYMNPIFV